MPIITIIIPVYKVEPYLRRCLNSLLSQTFADFDLVLIDDGSPDNCGRICDEYAEHDNRIHVIHQINAGLSAARNAGINWCIHNSDSDWITFIDSDDWVSPNYLEYLYKAIKETGLNISICEYVKTDGNNTTCQEPAFDFTIFNTEDYYVENRVNAIVAWGKLYRKELFSDIRYPHGRLHEDEFTTYKLLFGQKEVAAVNVPLYMYFQNSEGIMRSQWTPKRLDKIYAFEEQLYYFKNENFKHAYQMTAYIYIKELGNGIFNIQNNGNSKSEIINLRKSLKRALINNRTNTLLRNDPDYQWYLGLAFPYLMRINRIKESVAKRIKDAIQQKSPRKH